MNNSERDDAAFVTRLLQQQERVEPSAELRRRVALLPQRHPRQRLYWPFQRVWQPSLALAAAAVLGLMTGMLLPASAPESGTTANLEEGLQQGSDLKPALSSNNLAGDEDELDEMLALSLSFAWEPSGEATLGSELEPKIDSVIPPPTSGAAEESL